MSQARVAYSRQHEILPVHVEACGQGLRRDAMVAINDVIESGQARLEISEDLVAGLPVAAESLLRVESGHGKYEDVVTLSDDEVENHGELLSAAIPCTAVLRSDREVAHVRADEVAVSEIVRVAQRRNEAQHGFLRRSVAQHPVFLDGTSQRLAFPIDRQLGRRDEVVDKFVEVVVDLFKERA